MFECCCDEGVCALSECVRERGYAAGTYCAVVRSASGCVCVCVVCVGCCCVCAELTESCVWRGGAICGGWTCVAVPDDDEGNEEDEDEKEAEEEEAVTDKDAQDDACEAGDENEYALLSCDDSSAVASECEAGSGAVRAFVFASSVSPASSLS